MKSLMSNLGDLAGLDMVHLREAGFDAEAEPVEGGSSERSPDWRVALKIRAAAWLGLRRRALRSSPQPDTNLCCDNGHRG